MNVKLVLSLLGKLLLMFSVSFTVPAITAAIYSEPVWPYLVSAFLAILLGAAIASGFKSSEEFESLRHKESFAIVALIWLLISIIGAIPYISFGIHPVDAFFESMSGFTTTGASVLIPEDLPASLLMWRSMTQWIGGMGIIVLFLAIFPNVVKRSSALFHAEYPGVAISKIKPRIRETAMTLYKVYLTLTIAEIALLYLSGLSVFDAINHTFTTLSTGGYSTHSESIAYFSNPKVEAIIAFFAFLGGSNFALLYYTFRGKPEIFRNSEFRAYTGFLAIATLFLTVLNLEKYGLIDSLRFSAFQAVSIMTTTGFTTADFDTWSDSAKLILLTLMFIGGSSGSTGGGIKVVRIYLLIKYSLQQILRAAEPRTVRAVKFEGKGVKKELLADVAAFFILYIFMFTISSILISLSGYDIVTSISACAATLGNVGPGMGLAGAMENYAAFPHHAKILLSLNMWVGRLEIFTVLSLFIPSFWRERW
ncbi:TrkH family potassium uptake protein [Archaeoglobus neptunius]|uniref:TrkH family potassium uptake protein n=1 Tax=Archaeoglobus neptunius TaxID=2798580 RepID=UPI0019294550|nr:TrkH family potassium uptake protein [Archaeoglobus neptunius]